MTTHCSLPIVESANTARCRKPAWSLLTGSEFAVQRQSGRRLPGLAAISQFIRHLATRYETRRQQRIARDAFKHMESLSDELLADIGVNRDSVRWAAKLPIEVDAALALREVAQGGSRVEYR